MIALVNVALGCITALVLAESAKIGLVSSLAGADDVVEMARWANLNADFLRRYYPYARGFPSHDEVDVIWKH